MVRIRGRSLAAFLAAALWSVVLGGSAVLAHPLGNTTVNVYTRLEPGPDRVWLRWVLDVAEQPTQQELTVLDADGDGDVSDTESDRYLDAFWPYVRTHLLLEVDGRRMELERDAQTLELPTGQGGLPTLRVVYDLEAALDDVGQAPRSVHYRETTFDTVPGWHEVVVRAGAGAELLESTAPTVGLTVELRSYPDDWLNDPLLVTSADFTFEALPPTPAPSPTPTPVPSPSPSSDPQPSQTIAPAPTPAPPATAVPASPAPPVPPGSGDPEDPLVGLVGGDLGPAALLLGLGVAVVLGVLHGLSPGHGKTIVAAYLLGARADLRQAVWLGLIVAASHTVGVLALGIVVLGIREWLLPDRVVGWLMVASGVLVILLGASLLRRAIAQPDRVHAHPHGHPHGHPHPHPHDHPDAMPRRDLVGLGLVGGLVPSGSALLLLLAAIAVDRVPYGLLLIVAFGAGMALVFSGISLGIVLLRRSSWVTRGSLDPRFGWLVRSAPMISAVVVLVIGTTLTMGALAATV